MTAVLCGLAAALLWTGSNLASSRSVRMIGEYSVVAWVMAFGLLLSLPFAVIGTDPPDVDVTTLARLVGIGVAGVVGLLLLYAALRRGKVSVVAPIASTEGAVAAVISSVMGESLAPLAVAFLMVVVIGVVLSVMAPESAPIPHERPVLAALLAVAAAGCFGLALFLVGSLSSEVPLVWILLPPRVVGTLALFLPLLLVRRLRISRAALPFVLATATTEVLGYLVFGLGARESIAVVAVLASQVATFTAIGGRVLFAEQLGRIQVLGIVVVIAGVTSLAIAG